MYFHQIFDPSLAQYAYLIGCQRAKEAVVIDPQRDIDRYVSLAAAEGLKITAVAETHIHADFLSGAREFAERGARAYLSDEGGEDWKYDWVGAGSYDFRLLRHGDRFSVGNIELEAVHTPGHTPEHLSFLVLDKGGGADGPMGLVSGDFVFVGDLGRPDLLETAAGQVGAREPSARRLYASLPRFFDLPDYLQVWPGHGAGSACGKALGAVPMSTVGYEKRHNQALLAAEGGEQAFIETMLEGQPEPPLYFARMKQLNKAGPPVLGQLPRPERVSATDLEQFVGRADAVVLDTRRDRTAFMGGHLPGSLYAPFDKSFPTVAGSYVDAAASIYLVIDAGQVEEAVRQLVRVGLDRVEGWAPPETIAEIRSLRATEIVDFERGRALSRRPGVTPLDVRRLSEFERGHLPDAHNIAHTRLLARRGELPAGNRLVVYCQTGARAAVASALLERLGHEVFYVDDVFGQ